MIDRQRPMPSPTLLNSLRSGELGLHAYLDELEERFRAREPAVQAFVPEEGRFERLRQAADKLLRRYPNPLNRPPLFGVAIGVKDIFHVDGFPTRAGSRLPIKALTGQEAPSVTALRKAGALIVGKSVTTEFAYFCPGPTRNPHNLEHTPGGSSSGSAAAVAAGLCTLATGTQTIGSIIRPASFCGVVGYKPSYDRISRQGVIPLSPSLDHVGVFATDVAGAELVAGLLCMAWHLSVQEKLPVLGVPEGRYLEKASAEAQAHFRETCARLQEAGCIIRPIRAMDDFDEIVRRHNLIVAAEAAQVHARWFSRHRERYHEKTSELIQRGQTVSEEALAKALAGRQRLRSELTCLMDEHDLDLWVSPGAPGPAPAGLASTGDPVMNLPWTHCGLPAVNLPIGVNRDGLPMGLQVAGRWYEDETLLEWSAQLELIIRPNGRPSLNSR
jgi:Asp-tRNA(Asn)/Glu-tRNA(Gln) amidotransferase A subunit family amidase